MWILVLAVEVSGDQLSSVNVAGLGLCLLGISGHIVHKIFVIKSMTGNVKVIDDIDADFNGQMMNRTRSPKHDASGHEEPLLDDEKNKWSEGSDASDVDSNLVLYEVVQRRDTVR